MSPRAEVPGLLVTDYVCRAPDAPAELILLLHGFKQSGKYMMDRLLSVCPEDAYVLAPNGPYPLPERKEDGTYQLGFSWYFYDVSTDEYYVDMRVAKSMLQGLVVQLGLIHLPKRVIGFSQGGYLAPFVALELGQAKQVIGIGAEYLHKELGTWPAGIRVDVVHGEQDEVVAVASAQRGFSGMIGLGAQGELRAIPSEGHRISTSVRGAVGECLKLQP